ncbi:MAG: hypothetical protein RMJ28_02760 [Nitrososphaerota archaeon]|nr:hypothetical protein [Candidatus Calditenuaceae archaeon]MDW8073141.1 hypothetical protein [Nitrososphaerota archaeon]
MRLVLPVSSGPLAVEAGLSCLYRCYEEFQVNSVHIIYDRGESESQKVAEVASTLFGEGRARRTKLEVEESPGLSNSINGQVIEPALSDAKSVVAVLSPASRRVAAAIAIACSGLIKKAADFSRIVLAHLEFYWGEWAGLAYPYVPGGLSQLSR